MTSIRQAILLAADHIEANPDVFNFFCTEVPSCGTQACAAGWVGYFLGRPAGSDAWAADNGCLQIMGVSNYTFDDRMDAIEVLSWKMDASACARTLRLYADKYHPESFPSIRQELDRIAGMGIEKSGTGIAA